MRTLHGKIHEKKCLKRIPLATRRKMCYHILRAPVIRLWGASTLRRSAVLPTQQAAFFSIAASAGGFSEVFVIWGG